MILGYFYRTNPLLRQLGYNLDPAGLKVWYNLGCSFALLERTADAIVALQKAVEFGYTDAEYMRKDEDLATIRNQPEFERLVRGLEGDGE